MKETPLSAKASKWCEKTVKVAASKAFRVKAYQDLKSKFESLDLEFYVLPKIYQSRKLTHTDRQSKVYVHPKFLDEKQNLRKLAKDERDELKAALYQAVVWFAVKRTNLDYYKLMTRCPWEGPSVEGALGSTRPARQVLAEKREEKLKAKRKFVEVPTGLKEDVEMYDLTSQKTVLVKGADIFLANGNLKVAKGVHEGRKLRTMMKGGAELKEKLGL